MPSRYGRQLELLTKSGAYIINFRRNYLLGVAFQTHERVKNLSEPRIPIDSHHLKSPQNPSTNIQGFRCLRTAALTCSKVAAAIASSTF